MTTATMQDLDLDGLAEVLLADEGQVVAVKPGQGGGIGGWDVRAARHALAAALRRRPEAYHETLRAHDAAAASGGSSAGAAGGEGGGDGDNPMSIHDIVMVKEEGLAARLFYDDHERRSGLVRFLPNDTTPEAFAQAAETELADLRDGDFAVDHLAPGQVSLSREGEVAGQPVTVSKSIRLLGDRMAPELVIDLEVHHRGSEPIDCRIGLELSVHLLGGGGNPSAWYDVDGARSAHDGSGQAQDVAAIGYGNDWGGVAVRAVPEPAADAWWSPIETVSNSESGFERVYQGSSLLFSWPLRLAAGEARRFSLRQAVNVARDRSAAEAGATA